MEQSETAKTTTEETLLTPTTTKILSQILESEDLNNKIANDGFVVPLPPSQPSTPSGNKATLAALSNSRKSFVKLDSSSWQGGTTTVVTPTKSEQLTILDVPSSISDIPVMTMKTRSSSVRAPPRTVAYVQPQSTRKHANVKRTPKARPGVKAATNEFDLSPAEAEKLRIRRERNKAAAARCRKRRMDQISILTEEVEEHEEKKRILEGTIAQLKAQKEELEFILSQHQAECNLQVHQHLPMTAVKSEPVVVEPLEFMTIAKPETPTKLKPKRPLTLNIATANEAKSTSLEGVLIDTPSNIIANLGFDSLMTSTGLTPTTNIITPVSFMASTPTCSSQQRSSEMVLDLNTPASENISLVSL